MATRSRRILGLLLFVVFGFFAGTSFLLGITLDGKEAPAVQCGRSVPRPQAGGPFTEGTVITGERTFMPLGVNCTYDAPSDSFGPQTVVNENWPATVAWLVSSIVALFGATIMVAPRAPPKSRPMVNV
jgi:hypothetical protein